MIYTLYELITFFKYPDNLRDFEVLSKYDFLSIHYEFDSYDYKFLQKVYNAM